MSRKVLMVLLVAAMSTLVGCWSHSFSYADKTPAGEQEVGRTHLVFGLISDDPLMAYELCPSGVQGVHTQHTFGDMLLSCLTANIYTPNTVTVTCASGAAHNFYLDANDEVVAQQSFDENGTLVAENVKSDVL